MAYLYSGNTFSDKTINHGFNKKEPDKNIAVSLAIGGRSLSETIPDTYSYQTGKYLNESAYGTFYYRVLSSKETFNFGIITGEKAESFSLFNGFAETITLTSIEAHNLNGVGIPANLPITIAPYRSVILELQIHESGGSTIDGYFTFNYSNGSTSRISISGQRLVLLTIAPNWGDGLKEEFEYKTDVLSSYSKKEQRRSLLAKPRYTVAYTGIAYREQLMRLRNTLHSWHGRAFMLPIWYQRAKVLSGALTNSRQITIEGNPYDFIVNGNIVLWDNENAAEAFEILNIENNTLTLNAPISRNYSNPFAYPSVQVRLDEETEIGNLSHVASEIPLRLYAEKSVSKTHVFPEEYTFNNVEVLIRKPNWEKDVSDEHEAAVSRLDYGYGKQEWFARDVASLSRRKMIFAARSYSDILWWKSFLHRRKGQYSSFYMPTWTDDIAPIGDYLQGEVALRVRDDELSSLVKDSKERKIIRIQTTNEVYYREITDITGNNGIAQLTLNTPIERNIFRQEFVQISFVIRARLANDRADINFLSRTVAEITLQLQQIREV